MYLTEGEVLGIGDDFEALYERLYGKGAGFREAGLQLITYRVFGTGHLPFRPSLPAGQRGRRRSSAAKRRAVILDPHGVPEHGCLRLPRPRQGARNPRARPGRVGTTTVALPGGLRRDG